MTVSSKWKSRKFWVAIITAAGIILVDGLGIDLNWESIAGVALTIIGWIFAEAQVDSARAKGE